MNKPFISLILCLVLAVPAFAQSVASRQPLQATVLHVIDGDTIIVRTAKSRRIKIRLYGIDAPEWNQPGGSDAKAALRQLRGQTVAFRKMDTDHYGRTVAIVDYMGRCINLDLVAKGNAWFYPRHCTEPWFCLQLRIAGAQARAAGLGLWADKDPVPPWEWRKSER